LAVSAMRAVSFDSFMGPGIWRGKLHAATHSSGRWPPQHDDPQAAQQLQLCRDG